LRERQEPSPPPELSALELIQTETCTCECGAQTHLRVLVIRNSGTAKTPPPAAGAAAGVERKPVDGAGALLPLRTKGTTARSGAGIANILHGVCPTLPLYYIIMSIFNRGPSTRCLDDGWTTSSGTKFTAITTNEEQYDNKK
jgi:hypothetical protein